MTAAKDLFGNKLETGDRVRLVASDNRLTEKVIARMVHIVEGENVVDIYGEGDSFFILGFPTDRTSLVLYEHSYRCPCGIAWADTWPGICDDQCPACDTAIAPSRVEEVIPKGYSLSVEGL
mgnify:CR=1 FL=1